VLMSHPMMPATTHDEQAEQLFVRDLKIFLAEEIDPLGRRLADRIAPGPELPAEERLKAVRNELYGFDSYRATVSLRRTVQEMLWDAVGSCVSRQADELSQRGAIAAPKGSLTLDPDFRAPAYIRAGDVHLMPGGYHADWGEGDVLQGALMDRGGAVFMLGRNGGLMNDVRGHTAISHLFARFPDLEPRKILEMGCGVGASIVPAAKTFPQAEVHGIDVGASVLRYAHARAEHLGVAVHFSQQNAERTNFPDESFDFVYSCVLFHETSHSALKNIIAESCRLLRPGGVAVHLEVPIRYDELDLWGLIGGEFEVRYNNEPFWTGALKADYAAEMRGAGFRDVAVGYQDAVAQAQRGAGGFSDTSAGHFRSWFVASGRK